MLDACPPLGPACLPAAVHDRCGMKLHVADRKHAVMQQLDLPGAPPPPLLPPPMGASGMGHPHVGC